MKKRDLFCLIGSIVAIVVSLAAIALNILTAIARS